MSPQPIVHIDTLTDPDHAIILESMTFPQPVISITIEPKTREDSEKLGGALSKLAVYHGAEQTLGELLDLEALTQTIASRSEDAREGVRAFVEKRSPRFRGE